jgi:hypothetical protein
MATGNAGMPIESLVQEADHRMYEHKREYYENARSDRRRP